MPRHNMETCTNHGDSCVVVYDYDGCPFCEQESRARDLEQEIEDLKSELKEEA